MGRTSSTWPGCPKPHSTWHWKIPGRGHLHLLWTTYSSASQTLIVQCFFWCSPRYSQPSGLRVHIVGPCPAFHPPVSPSLSQQGFSGSLCPLTCIDTGGCANPGAGLYTRPCWTSWGSHGPTSQASPGPSGWHPIPQVCQPHHTSWCHLKTCWGCTRFCCLGH